MRQLAIFILISVLLSMGMKLYSNTPFIDSLELEIKDVHGKKKLERMFQIANIYITSEKLFSIGSWIEGEAKKQNNLRYLAGSYNLKARYHLDIRNDLDSVIYYGRLANEMYDNNNIKNTNQGHFYITQAYLNRGYYALAISYLKALTTNHNQSILDMRPNNILNQIYFQLGDYESCIEYLEKDAKSIQTIDILNVENNRIITIIENYLRTAQTYYYMQKYDEAYRYITMVENLLDTSVITSEVLFNHIQFSLNLIRLDFYLSTKSIELFQLRLDELKQISTKIDLNLIQEIELKSREGQYFFLTGDYKKALPLFEECISFLKDNYPSQVSYTIKTKIETLKKLGWLDEVLDVQANLMQYKDSLYRQNLSTLPYQVAELSETNQLAEVRLEHEKDQAILEKSRTINISLIIAFVVLGVMFYIVRQNLKKTREKNKLLVKQYNELEKQKNLLKGKSSTSKENQRESTLFEEIETYIEQNEAFRDSTLNRESLAKALNTNEIYVAKAIKQITGKTFVEYINQYRLEYSRQRLLAEISEPVKVILQDAGFSSDTSFYRLFKEAYGMSSSEMRQAKEEIDKENATKE